ncbi:MAG: adenosylmethionine--8-amino-7-oxononanoate transaminase [Victivallaceae bacterium]|jgi:adenosylmethionine-8-amino-7-oxononanoate aminotransferase
MNEMDIRKLIEFDRRHLWHPYSSMTSPLPVYPVESAHGVRIRLADGMELIDGTSSWWAAAHGYNHPKLNDAIKRQLEKMAHVMFGGLTHEPAAKLGERLIRMTPEPLQTIFYSDSGSVSVEVAVKMAFQYWLARNYRNKTKLLTVRSGYHGDTFATMGLCDPVDGMHKMFHDILPENIFAEAPRCKFNDPWDENCINDMLTLIDRHHSSIAAVIIEPIVQGAGGMRFYSPHYLRRLREICSEYDILLIFDEIATGFGRTGKLFACEHAGVSPDIMCVGKALTGGYMTLAATITTNHVSETVSSGMPGIFLHGPTYMANPLACAVACASLDLLEEYNWQEKVLAIEKQMKEQLEPARSLPAVADVRVLGAIGVIETREPVKVAEIQAKFVWEGVWIRPFGKLIYLMPPFIISRDELSKLTAAAVKVAGTIKN